MTRGSKGEVTVRKNDKKGRYEARLTVGYAPDGKQIRQMFTGRSRAEVRTKIKTAEQALVEGRSSAPETRTVEQYLTEWVQDVLPGTVADATQGHYADVIRLYIVPNVGAKKLVSLAPADVSRMMRTMEAEGKAPNTQRLARSILRRALRRAEQEGIVTRNAAAIADGPKVGASEGRTLTVEQGTALLEAVKHDRMGAAFMVALTLGLRRGELLGLSWADIDLDGDRPTMTITRSLKRIAGRGLEVSETKTSGSRRRIHLPAPTVAALKHHRARMNEERLLLGSAWPAKPLGCDLVFRTPLGTAVDPDNFRHMVYRVTTEVLGERWSPHELRHSAASLLLAQGVDLKVISELLGHSSIRITADVYGHLLDDAGLVAADAMTALFAGAPS